MAKLLGSANIIKTSTPKPKRDLTITIPKNMIKQAQTLTQLPARPNSIVTVVEEGTRLTKQKPVSTGILRNPHKFPTGFPTEGHRNDRRPGQTFNKNNHKGGKNTKSVKVTFDLPVAPTSLVDPTGRIHNLYPCRVPYIRCNRCQGHWHSINNCPNLQNTCPHCAGKHTYGECLKRKIPGQGNAQIAKAAMVLRTKAARLSFNTRTLLTRKIKKLTQLKRDAEKPHPL